jgi:site-specific DNA-methyltransferase (adenine-specific)
MAALFVCKKEGELLIDLRLGDCLEVMKDIPDGSIDLIVTDPPYLMNYKTGRRKNKNHDFCSVILNDDNQQVVKEYIKECYRILKNNAAMYMFCNANKIDVFKQEVEKYFTLKNIIIWVKNNHTAGDLKAQFSKKTEMILLANKGRREFNGERLTDVWEFARVSGKKQLHQNQKPVELLEQCILKHSNPGDVVFDGFMGSGSTGIACLNTGRKFIGIELDENYFNIAKERIG